MENEIQGVPIGSVKLLGKIWGYDKFPTLKVHYLVFEDVGPISEEGYSAVALELGIFIWSPERDKAKTELFSVIDEYLAKPDMLGSGIDDFLSRPDMDKFWMLYRRLIFLIGDPETKSHDKLQALNNDLVQDLANVSEKNAEMQVDLALLREKFNLIQA